MVELNAAVALDPAAPHFRNNLGYAYYLQGKLPKRSPTSRLPQCWTPRTRGPGTTWGWRRRSRQDRPRRGGVWPRDGARVGWLAGAVPARAVSSPPAQQSVQGLAASAVNDSESGSGTAAAETTAMEPTRVVETTVLVPFLWTLVPRSHLGDGAVAAEPGSERARAPSRRWLCDPNRLPRRAAAAGDASSIPMLRRLEPAELQAPADLAAALANPVATSAAVPLLEPVSTSATTLEAVVALEPRPSRCSPSHGRCWPRWISCQCRCCEWKTTRHLSP